MKKLTTIDAEAVSQRYSVKMVFLEISQNSQEISCNFIKKEALAQVFPCEFCEICNNTFFLQNTSGGCFCRCNATSLFKIILEIFSFVLKFSQFSKNDNLKSDTQLPKKIALYASLEAL